MHANQHDDSSFCSFQLLCPAAKALFDFSFEQFNLLEMADRKDELHYLIRLDILLFLTNVCFTGRITEHAIV